MGNKILIELHPLGDILFNQKLFAKIIESGWEVYFPLPYKYNWVKDYINKPNLFWHGTNDPYLYFNLGESQVQNHPYDVMTCKYSEIGRRFPFMPKELQNVDWSDWSQYLKIDRNIEKENELYYKHLGLLDDSKYILANKNYGMNQVQPYIESRVNARTDIQIIWLDFFPQFTLFDWSKVIENATEIHTVDTSILYLIEVLNQKANSLNLYPRHQEYILKAIGRLFNKNWKYIYE